MCDTVTEAELDRRGFARLAGAAGAAALLVGPAQAAEKKSRKIMGHEVEVQTPDGLCDAYYAHPRRGRHPGVVIWPDIRGLRPAFKAMAERLAADGHAVLVVNPFYRSARSPVLAPDQDWSAPATRERLFGYAAALTRDAVGRDAGAFADFLGQQPAFNPRRKLASAGYCLGGPFTIFAAAAHPGRYGAGASFHGSRQSSDAPDSPHRLIPATNAGFLFALAENDDQRDPAEKDRLRAALAGRPQFAEVEVYPGAMHGWCPPDSRAYNEPAAERAWGRMLALFAAAL